MKRFGLNSRCSRITGWFCARGRTWFADVENTAMVYVAVAIAILGFAMGTLFRLQVLLVVIALLLLFSIVFSFGFGLNFSDSLLAVMAAQTVVQGSYFFGLLTHAALTSS
jgi:hypothetical protein